ncbi:MAG TPA: hypothetical protein DCW55_00085 [Candidatus Pacebacteria bacterium]|nr:MAG: hypothetical protein A2378_03645 [Candidatus Pacebacteria bacterium RIFOXYB1_FULL_44_10]HAU98613.1 hypothetical protein [Candidatus Paceibacterota bacterium]HAX01217.1 hypothetical protein [Candidatus Paceibacterota bacterium]
MNNAHLSPIQYYRQSAEWRAWIGKTGVVVQETTVFATPTDVCGNQAYQLALIELENGERRVLPVCLGEQVAVGDRVMLVLRKLRDSQTNSVIEYGMKCRLHHRP